MRVKILTLCVVVKIQVSITPVNLTNVTFALKHCAIQSIFVLSAYQAVAMSTVLTHIDTCSCHTKRLRHPCCCLSCCKLASVFHFKFQQHAFCQAPRLRPYVVADEPMSALQFFSMEISWRIWRGSKCMQTLGFRFIFISARLYWIFFVFSVWNSSFYAFLFILFLKEFLICNFFFFLIFIFFAFLILILCLLLINVECPLVSF